jgi:alpha-1,2-glucosyltransferase
VLGGALVAAVAAVHQTLPLVSVAHPFLLADNRHYTFYLWRRLLGLPRLAVVLAPLYVVSLATLARCLGTQHCTPLTPIRPPSHR